MTRQSPSNLAIRAPSSVADITNSRKSSRRPCCTSRASARPRSASSERSWNSSNSTAATPSSDGSSRMSRVKIPSVITSMRVLRDTFEPKRTRKPTVSPTLSCKVAAIRSAAARAARRRGSSTRIFLSAAHSASISHSGTRVVLPAPGGATSTAACRCRNAAVRRGSASSIGSAVSNRPIAAISVVIVREGGRSSNQYDNRNVSELSAALGPGPADALVDEAALAHLLGQVDVAQIDDRRRPGHRLLQPVEVERAELLPFRADHQRVRALGAVVLVAAINQLRQQLLCLLHADRIVGPHLGAHVVQRGDQR